MYNYYDIKHIRKQLLNINLWLKVSKELLFV
jgi:hypothetical protein